METSRRASSRAISYAKALASIAIRSKAVIASLVVCQLLFLLPMFASYPTGSVAIDREMCRTNAYLVKDGLLSNGSEFPDDLLALEKQIYQCYQDALDAPYPSKEYFAAFGKAREAEAAEQEAGYLTGGLETQASATLLRQLSELEDPQSYTSAQELPTLNYLSLAAGVMPGVTLILPGILAAYEALKRLHGYGLFSVAPLGPAKRSTAVMLATVPFAILSPLAVSLPAAAVSLVRNGLGDPSFPIVLIMGSSITTSTVLASLVKDLLLLALFETTLAFFMALVSHADCKLALGLGLLTAILPLMPFYVSETAPWHEFGHLLPMTYLRLDQVVGYPTYANGLDITVFTGATFGRGVAVLVITAALLAIATIATASLDTRTPSSHARGGGRHD